MCVLTKWFCQNTGCAFYYLYFIYYIRLSLNRPHRKWGSNRITIWQGKLIFSKIYNYNLQAAKFVYWYTSTPYKNSSIFDCSKNNPVLYHIGIKRKKMHAATGHMIPKLFKTLSVFTCRLIMFTSLEAKTG